MPLTARCSPGASPPGSKGYVSRLQPRPPPNSSPSTARPPGGPTTATTTVGRCTGCRPAGVGGRVQRDHRHPTPARTPRPTGALVTIDAMGTQARIAQAILDCGGDRLLAVKNNQPSLRDKIRRYLDAHVHSAEASPRSRCASRARRAGAFRDGFAGLVVACRPAAAQGKPVEAWFIDKARVGQQGTLTRVRAPRGTRPRTSRGPPLHLGPPVQRSLPRARQQRRSRAAARQCRNHDHPPGRDQSQRDARCPRRPRARPNGLAHLAHAARAREHQRCRPARLN